MLLRRGPQAQFAKCSKYFLLRASCMAFEENSTLFSLIDRQGRVLVIVRRASRNEAGTDSLALQCSRDVFSVDSEHGMDWCDPAFSGALFLPQFEALFRVDSVRVRQPRAGCGVRDLDRAMH